MNRTDLDRPDPNRASGAWLIVVTGWTGAGKSTVAAAVADDLSATVASFDWVMSALRSQPDVWASVELPLKRQRRVGWDLLSRIAEQQLARGSSCVLDLVARQTPRMEWEQLAARYEANFGVIECVCRDEAVHRQLPRRQPGESPQLARRRSSRSGPIVGELVRAGVAMIGRRHLSKLSGVDMGSAVPERSGNSVHAVHDQAVWAHDDGELGVDLVDQDGVFEDRPHGWALHPVEPVLSALHCAEVRHLTSLPLIAPIPPIDAAKDRRHPTLTDRDRSVELVPETSLGDRTWRFRRARPLGAGPMGCGDVGTVGVGHGGR